MILILFVVLLHFLLSFIDIEDEPDSDLEVETENPNWQSTVVDKKVSSLLSTKQKVRSIMVAIFLSIIYYPYCHYCAIESTN